MSVRMPKRASLASPGPEAAARRSTELGLVGLAVILAAGGYVLTALAEGSELPADLAPFAAGAAALALAAHAAVRRFAPRADGTLLGLAILLNGIGFVTIARLDHDLARYQAVWTAVGVGAFVATLAAVKRIRDLERYRYTFALIGIGSLILPAIPGIGREINGARLWVQIGPLNFQPGEAAKVLLVIFLAAYLVEKRELLSTPTWRVGGLLLPDPKHFAPLLLAWGGSILVMVREKDLGSSLLFFAVFLAMLYMATARASYVAIGAGLFAAGATIAYQIFGHVRDRVTTWLDPWPSAQDQGFQLVQALFAFGSGGFAGTGLGLGSPGTIPNASTDFVFAAIGEELGLIGTTAVLIVYLLLVGVGFRIALRAEQPFLKLLAAGLTTILGVQTFIILGGVTRLIPLTGITLPFVSYGGSSLLANFVILALLLRISDEVARRVGLVVVGCFVALFLQLNYLQVIRADSLATDARNVRAVKRAFSDPRGEIVTVDGVIVARSEPVDDQYERLRTYPTGELFAHVSGFFSFNYGASGVEDAYNRDLNGRNPGQQFRNLGDWLIGKEPTGDAVLSLRLAAQEAARDALGDRRGSVVVLDPSTGEVVALWSNPSYDPAPLASHDFAAAGRAFDGYAAGRANPMLARAYRERYAPGSTFKVVTAATAIDTGTAGPDTGYPSLRSLNLPQSDKQLRNFGGSLCGGSMAESFRRSCNTTFGQIGLDLGEKLIDGMRAFGIGEDVPFDLPEARSGGPAPGTFDRNKPSFANAAIGQGDIAVTPLQMAMVAGTIANGGVMMAPHVVREIRDQDGQVIRRIGPDEWKRAVSPATAAAVTSMMVDVVRRGTGTAAAVPGHTVAGKTGTAEAPAGPGESSAPHAWFIGFAPADAPRFAIAVIVERGGDIGDEATGGRVAAPVAGRVLQTVLALPPVPSPSPPDEGKPTSTTAGPRPGGR